MIGPLLVVVGLLGFYVMFKGKSDAVINAMTGSTVAQTLDTSIASMFPTTTNAANIVAGTNGPSSVTTSSANQGTSLFTVPINGPNGSGAGFITVVANDAAAALKNATQGGNTPTGSAVQLGA